ncbi:hypothetical protein [Ruminococcus flavefaciens]|uniref:hypothetical protein n=1 Tax=Ruminococcus flavefaciens TaxID=1265 RepID=UPI0026F33C5D|nr:hypothetical protein [Ruminococcus flavefaciens]
MAVTSNPKRTMLLIAFMAAFAIFALGCMETVMYFKGDPYYVHIDDLDYCNEERAIEGESGRVFSLYRIQEVKTHQRHGRSKYKISYLYYYIFDNASTDDIEKMRKDRSYVPENYRVYSFYTSDEDKKKELDKLCVKWNAYMNGSSDTMPDTFCIDGRVSPKSFYEYDVGEFKNAARKCGFAEDQITSLLIFDDPVSINGVFATIAAAAALVVLTFFLIKNRRNDKGYY